MSDMFERGMKPDIEETLLMRSIQGMYEFERFIFSLAWFPMELLDHCVSKGYHVQSCRSSFRCSSPLFADGGIYQDKSAQSEAGPRDLSPRGCVPSSSFTEIEESAYRRSVRLLKSQKSRDSFAFVLKPLYIYYFCYSTRMFTM